MREQAAARLEELRREFEAGQSRLNQLEMEEARLRETLLRISGAIQVLQEFQTPPGVGDGGQQVGQQGATIAADKAGDASGPE